MHRPSWNLQLYYQQTNHKDVPQASHSGASREAGPDRITLLKWSEGFVESFRHRNICLQVFNDPCHSLMILCAHEATVLVMLCALFPTRCESKMKHLSFLCLFALVALHGHDGALAQAPSYGERGSDLGIQVFQQEVSSRPLDNIVLSPHGVASVLGMLLPGADGETRKQVLTALRYKKNGTDLLSLQPRGILTKTHVK